VVTDTVAADHDCEQDFLRGTGWLI